MIVTTELMALHTTGTTIVLWGPILVGNAGLSSNAAQHHHQGGAEFGLPHEHNLTSDEVRRSFTLSLLHAVCE